MYDDKKGKREKTSQNIMLRQLKAFFLNDFI